MDLPRYWATLLRSSVIGCWLGITPGGAIAASFMGYNLAKRFSKEKDSFGKGRIEGVFAPETAAHASGTSALLPMLALGIPGSGTAAILLGGLMVWGLNPGPLLFVEHKDFVWGLIASMYLGNIVGLVLVLTTVPIFASILGADRGDRSMSRCLTRSAPTPSRTDVRHWLMHCSAWSATSSRSRHSAAPSRWRWCSQPRRGPLPPRHDRLGRRRQVFWSNGLVGSTPRGERSCSGR